MKHSTSNLGISKSLFLLGLQCRKQFWLKIHEREIFPPVDEATQAIFDQGHEIGILAQSLFPEGIMVEGNHRNFNAIATRTSELLVDRRPLFEGGFLVDSGFARVDILNPVDGDEWELIEVKSGTSVKEVNVFDTAFQLHLCEKSGLRVRRTVLMHLNRSYTREGDLDVSELFALEDVTSEVQSALPFVIGEFDELKKTAALDQCPEIRIGPHCSKPYECPLKDSCWSFLPEYPVTDLYRGKAKAFDLLDDGVSKLGQIPTHMRLNAKQEIQRNACRSGEPFIDFGQIDRFLSNLEYPLSFLDFETFRHAVPPYDGVRPYQQIPFQYSLHVCSSPDERPDHLGYLAEDSSDRRREFMEHLLRSLPDSGSIVVYNASFEIGRLRECADSFPEYQDWVNGLEDRIVDLLIPFRNFHFYHRDQHGSASIKAVLPVLTDESYSSLEIRDGDTASLSFLESCSDEISRNARSRTRKNLEEYCEMDTLAMIKLILALEETTTNMLATRSSGH